MSEENGPVIDFDFTLDQQKEILYLASLYKREARKCYSAKAYLAGCIMMGAALEALLLTALNTFPELILNTRGIPRVNKKGEIKNFENWKLEELIRVAGNLGWLPSSLSSDDEWNIAKAEIGDYAKLVQQLRNYIHPVKYAKEIDNGQITKKYLDACFNIVDGAAVHLSRVIKNYLSILKKEQERRKAD